MIIWINGAFGSGKTTLANNLLEKLPNSEIFNIGKLGEAIHKLVPHCSGDSYQDIPLWRSSVVEFLTSLEKDYVKNLIVCNSILDGACLSDLINRISSKDCEVKHFFLNIDEDFVRDRINIDAMNSDNQELAEKIRMWRHEQLDKCLDEKVPMPNGTIYLDAGSSNPTELLFKVLNSI